MAFPKDISADRLSVWAEEHLMYEVTMLVYATAEIGNQPDEPSPLGNALLESFAVHARSLDHFLWRDRDRKPRDAFATDFCGPGDWVRERDCLKRSALDKIETGKRFGREVMHLTYDRIDGWGDKKKWPCGEATLEIAAALERFAPIALPDRLDEDTREFLLGLRSSLEPSEKPTHEDLMPNYNIAQVVGATGIDLANFKTVTGGTIHFSEIFGGS